jgi:hypothetical protein
MMHPLVMLFPNFKLMYGDLTINLAMSWSEFTLKHEITAENDSTYRVDLIPGEFGVFEARQAVLALIRLIKNSEEFLANQMIRFFDVIGKQGFFSKMLENLSFECGDISFEETLKASLSSSQQFLKVRNLENGKAQLMLNNVEESSVKEVQFLRQLVLPVNENRNLQNSDEFFEVLVETMEHKYLGFVFCKRGVYLSRRVENKSSGDYVSMQLLSFPRENQKRLTGFFPSMISLLIQESPAFAQQFKNFLEYDISNINSSGASLLLNYSLNDIRNNYKHWLKLNNPDTHSLQGEGTHIHNKI